MISIQPPAADSSVGGDTQNTVAEPEQSTKRRIPLASIPATISIGLLIATMYLGGRIISARRASHPAPVASSAPIVSRPSVQPAAKPAEVIKDTAPPKQVEVAQVAVAAQVAVVEKVEKDDLPLAITPVHGQHYIQVGALEMNAEATQRFVKRLRAENLDPHIAPGPTPALMRVLIGPFDNIDALNEKKAQLEGEGIQTFVRKY